MGFEAVGGRTHQVDRIGALGGGHQCMRDPHRGIADERPVPGLFGDLYRAIGGHPAELGVTEF